MVVKLSITPKEHDIGDFSVRRVLPYMKQRMVGPWVFFDHMGPAQFDAGKGINVRPHPHINLATVTYLFEGEILHRDSLGSLQPIKPGDINLMVAGSGITHSERERDEVRSQPHSLHGLQLWHALPEEDEETDPAFYHYPDADIPAVTVGNVPVRVMMGSAYGVTSPVKTFVDTLFVEAHLQTGKTLELPAADELALYVVTGQVMIDELSINAHTMTVFDGHAGARMTATADTRIAIIGGTPLGERHINWNFVSSRKDRITQARQDWKDGKFPKVPGDDIEFIPLPE